MKTLLSICTFFCMLISFQLSFSQSVTVSGYVLNEHTGAIVKNASVFEAAAGIGTISNSSGFYKLILSPGEKQLKITDSGFRDFSESFKLKSDTVLSVKLVPLQPEKLKDKPAPELEANKSGHPLDESSAEK